MSKIYYSVEYCGTPERHGACYGSSLVRSEAQDAVDRAAARGLSLAIVERSSRPNVAGWLTPCHVVLHGRRRAR